VSNKNNFFAKNHYEIQLRTLLVCTLYSIKYGPFSMLPSTGSNQDKSAARFCHQVAAWVPDIFCNFYMVKSHKIAYNSATNEAREKISTDLESFEFLEIL
jgi:hypothetical protein